MAGSYGVNYQNVCNPDDGVALPVRECEVGRVVRNKLLGSFGQPLLCMKGRRVAHYQRSCKGRLLHADASLRISDYVDQSFRRIESIHFGPSRPLISDIATISG